MDDLLRNFLLVLCGLGALVLLIVTYMWYFVFGRSLRGVLMAGLSILMNRDSTIDLNADIEITKRPEDVKKEMPQEVEALDFRSEVLSQSPYVPQVPIDEGFSTQVVDPLTDKRALVSSSFGAGRFRRVVNAMVRPFLKMRVRQQSNVSATNVEQGQDINQNE